MSALDGLARRTIARVCIEHGVTLLTDALDEIRLGTSATLTDAHGTREVDLDVPTDAAALVPLVHRTIESVENDSGSLDLRVDGMTVRVGPDPWFEAWTVTRRDGAMVVCGPGGTVSEWPRRGDAGDLVTLTAEELALLNRAIVVWTGRGQYSWPHPDDRRVMKELGPAVAPLVPRIHALRDTFYESDAALTSEDWREMRAKAVGSFRARFPTLTDEAVDALWWCYAYDWR